MLRRLARAEDSAYYAYFFPSQRREHDRNAIRRRLDVLAPFAHGAARNPVTALRLLPHQHRPFPRDLIRLLDTVQRSLVRWTEYK